VALRVLHHSDDQLGRIPLWIWLACPALLLIIVAAASVMPAKWALAVNPLAITRDS
jgi:hypothetical protein